MSKIFHIVLNSFKNDSRVLKESLSLKKASYDVEIIALWEDGLKEIEILQGLEVNRIKLKSKRLPKDLFSQFVKYLEFLYKASKTAKNSDILHCHDLNTLPIGVFVKKFLNKKVKLVYDTHEYATEMNGLTGIRKSLAKILEKSLIKYADKVITVSESIANEYKRLYPFIEKPTVILNTPPYKEEVRKKDLFRKRFKISKDEKIFLYQGGLTSGRGIDILLEVFKNLQNTNAVIVFMGYGYLESKIQEFSKKYKNIFLHPAVSFDVLLDYTASADFGISFIEDICLSYRYSLPNKLFEYIMAEVPVIASNLPEMKKIVEKHNIGIVTEDNTVQGFKKAIEKALSSNTEIFINNLKKVKQEYSWENQEKKLLSLYSTL